MSRKQNLLLERPGLKPRAVRFSARTPGVGAKSGNEIAAGEIGGSLLRRGFVTELSLCAARAVGDRDGRIIVGQVHAPPVARFVPWPLALLADEERGVDASC